MAWIVVDWCPWIEGASDRRYLVYYYYLLLLFIVLITDIRYLCFGMDRLYCISSVNQFNVSSAFCSPAPLDSPSPHFNYNALEPARRPILDASTPATEWKNIARQWCWLGGDAWWISLCVGAMECYCRLWPDNDNNSITRTSIVKYILLGHYL